MLDDQHARSWLHAQIAFWRRRAEGDTIVVVNVDGSGERSLSVPREGATSPVWSPDGEYIAYVGQGQIRVMTATGGGKRKLIDGPYSEPSELDLGVERSITKSRSAQAGQ